MASLIPLILSFSPSSGAGNSVTGATKVTFGSNKAVFTVKFYTQITATVPGDAQRWVEKLISDRQRLVTDAEVLQEILHRYVAINRRDAIQPAFASLLGIVDEVFAVDRQSPSVLRKSSWDIVKCRLAMPSTSPSWISTESIGF